MIRIHQYLTLASMVCRTDQSVSFHVFDNCGGAVISYPQMPLNK
jgi:hypothetical protein